ncbi:MAG TPA: hypothetical protein VE981_04980 [Planctomycetota bacterium]|nr:hypothetical protein [Planctomycetota bacterium]
MLVFAFSLLAAALLSALLGFKSLAWGLAAVTCAALIVFVVASTATLVWQLNAGRHSAPPV